MKNNKKVIKKSVPKRNIFRLRYKLSIAMISLTVLVIVSMSYYFMNHESQILRENIIKMAQAEIQNLNLIVLKSLDNDDLTIISVVDKLKNDTSVKYTYILSPEGIILFSFDNEQTGKLLDDSYTPELTKRKDKTIFKKDLKDPDVKNGLIYDFSMPVHSVYKVNGEEKIIAYIRIGFSDKIITQKIAEMKQVVLYIALIFITIAVIAAFIVSYFTTAGIKKLSEGAAVIGTGNLDFKINIKTKDEIGLLAEEFNNMTIMLKQAKNKEIESRLMEEQLEVAKEIQEGLNPMGYYNKKGIQIKGFTRAAKGVGGDYFDYIDIDEHRIGALISDVSGKGIPASLVMVMIRTVFVTAVHQAKKAKIKVQCKNIVGAINNSLSADFAIDKFATLFFMIYDREEQKLSFANAGHGPLFCYRSDKDAVTVSKLDGVPIGIMEETEYNQAIVSFNPGDIVVLYTDGISEMRNPEKEEYGRTRLQQILLSIKDKSAEEIISDIVADVETFRNEAPPHDDMTILVMKRDS